MNYTQLRAKATRSQKLKEDIGESIKANRRAIYEECRKQMQKQKIDALLATDKIGRLDVHNASLAAIEAAARLFDQKMKKNNEFADIIIPRLKQEQAEIYKQSEQFKKEEAYKKIIDDYQARIPKKKSDKQQESEARERQAVVERQKQSKQAQNAKKNTDNKEKAQSLPKREPNLPEKNDIRSNNLNPPTIKQVTSKQEKKEQPNLLYSQHNPVSVKKDELNKLSFPLNDKITKKTEESTEKLVPSPNNAKANSVQPFFNTAANPFLNNNSKKQAQNPNVFTTKSSDSASSVQNKPSNPVANNQSSSLIATANQIKPAYGKLFGPAVNTQGQVKGASILEDIVKNSYEFSPPPPSKK